MAQRRMFSPDIVCSDAFLDMPSSSQSLYYCLGMYADDDGFINPRKYMRMLGASEDDLKILLAKRFLLVFEDGVVVIKHWKINNLVRKDWYRPTLYTEHKKELFIKENGSYTLEPTKGIPLVNEMLTTSLTEDRIDQVRIDSVPQNFEIVKDEPTKPKRVTPVAEVVFKIFKEEFGKYPLNWKTNRTQRTAAENLWNERGEVQIRKALRFHRENKDEPFCPTITSPWDLDSKWLKLANANKKQNGS